MKLTLPFHRFFLFILFAFLFSWIGLVVLPWMELGHQPPIQDADSEDLTPWNASGAAHAGEHVYAADGCVYCHTQQVRPASSGADLVRGWGTAKDGDGKDVTRRTYPRDYIWQGRVFLGYSRNGADLSNVGDRFPDEAALYNYLYDPYILSPRSSMPEYRFLFVKQKISGRQADDALDLTGADAPPAGYEIVPSPEAKVLVAYLLSLKKGYHLKPDEAGLPYVPPSTKSSS